MDAMWHISPPTGPCNSRHRFRRRAESAAATPRTTIPVSNGDNAGIGTGVVTHMVMGPCRHSTGAFTVLLKGLPATRMTSVSTQNNMNAVGCRLVPSQPKILLLAA